MFRKKLVASICGHKTKQKGKVTAFGKTTRTEMSLNDSKTVDFCLDCIAKMAICCGWCGNVIFIGDPVTIYRHNAGTMPKYAVKVSENSYIGCLGSNCADTGADITGFWEVDPELHVGYVQRIRSMYSAAITGGAAVNNNLSQP